MHLQLVAPRYVDDIDSVDDAGANNAPLLMCLVEQLRGGMGADERVDIGMITICPSTGDVIWDEFEGKFLINALTLFCQKLITYCQMATCGLNSRWLCFVCRFLAVHIPFLDKDGALQTCRTIAARAGADEAHRANAQLFFWVGACTRPR